MIGNPIPFIQRELRLLWSSRVARLGIVAVVAFPLLYAGLYLWAFWDPTGNLRQVPAAIVNEDVPVAVNGKTLAVGNDLASSLVSGRKFDWSAATLDEAKAGLANGRYYFAVVIPSDFSAAIGSAVDPATARQARFSLLLDDANSYIGTTIASRAVLEIRTELAAKVGSRYVEALLVGLGDARAGVSRAADGASSLSRGLAELKSGTASLAGGARTVAAGATALSAASSNAVSGASALADGLSTLEDGTRALAGATDRLAVGASALRDVSSEAASGAGSLGAGTAKVADGATSLASSAKTLSASVSDLTTGSRSVAEGASNVAAGSETLAGTLKALAADPNLDPTTVATLSVAVEKASALAAGAGLVADGASALATASGKLGTGATALAAGANDVADGASSAAAGVARLADGTASVAAGAGKLATGATAVNAGARDVASGATDAAAGARRLASGTTALSAGAKRLADGTTGLASGAAGVASGVEDAAAGASKLTSGLAGGAADVPALSQAEVASAAQTIAAPVNVDTVHVTPSTSYGVGLAPYFVGLALWVGAVFVFGLIRPVARRNREGGMAVGRRVLAGFLLASVITAAQALVLLAVLVGGLGLAPAFPVELAAFLVLTAIAFGAVIQALNAVLGGVGRVIAIVVLIVQLAASGGTYPIETAPEFFRALNPFVPMMYFVMAVRRLISGGSLEPVTSAAIVLVAVTLGSLVVTWVVTRIGREKEGMIDFGPAKGQPESIRPDTGRAALPSGA